MESVSNRFHEVVYSGETIYHCNLNIKGNTILPNQIQSITISSPIIDTQNDTFYIGTFISQTLKIVFKNINELDIKSGYDVDLKISLMVDGEPEEVQIGKYLIEELAENYQKTNEITCIDYGVKFKPTIDYSNAFDITYTLTQDVEINPLKAYYTRQLIDEEYQYFIVENPVVEDIATYYERYRSITLEDLLAYICDYYAVELGDYPDVNNDIIVTENDDTITGKQYISWIAELMGGNAKMDRYGRLTIKPLNSTPVQTINYLSSKELELGEKYKISGVTYFDAIRPFEYGNSNDNVLYIRQNNMFVTSTEDIENVYNAVEGFECYTIKSVNRGDISLDSWDILEYTDGTNTFNVINDNTLKYATSLIMTNIDVKIPTKQQQTLVDVKKQKDIDNIRKVWTTIDDINGKITLGSINTQKLSSEVLNNTYLIGENYRTLLQKFGDYTTKEETVTLQTDFQQQIDDLGTTYASKVSLSDGSVSKVLTTNTRIDNDGVSVYTTDEEGNINSDTKGNFNEKGIEIIETSSNTTILFGGYVTPDRTEYQRYLGNSILASQNIVVKNFMEVGDLSRFQEYVDDYNRTTIGCFWIG